MSHHDDPPPDEGGQACCILEICCGGARQAEALADFLRQRVAALNRREAALAAAALCAAFDFAAKGTLGPYRESVIRNVLDYTDEVRAYREREGTGEP